MLPKEALNRRCVVAMVGDGINDAPVSSLYRYLYFVLTAGQALAASDIGIAIGSGSELQRLFDGVRTNIFQVTSRYPALHSFLYLQTSKVYSL
jgi:hypothetical protein